jgi:ABC-type Na+ efflux pump permease subunit
MSQGRRNLNEGMIALNPMNWILLIAALIAAFLVFTFVLKVARAAIGTAIALVVLLVVLQVVFGIGPGELWQEVVNLWRSFWRMVGGA